MFSPQSYQTLREVIIKVVPEIPLYLSERMKIQRTIYQNIEMFLSDSTGTKIKETVLNDLGFLWPREKITLADVLRAIREVIEENGEAQDKLLYQYWDLTKDLDDQSDEVKQFLFNILVK